MIIYTIKLNGIDYTLAEPITIIEEEYIMNGKRVVKSYNNDLRLLSYCNDIIVSRNAMISSVNLLVNSVLFDPDWICKNPAPLLKRSLMKFENCIRRHVYGN